MARDTTKLQYWTEHIKNWQASGLAQRAYCEREGLKWPMFDYWRRQLLAKASVVKLAKKKSIGTLTLVPVRVAGKPDHDAIVLYSPAGWELRVPIAIDPAWLTDVLKRLS